MENIFLDIGLIIIMATIGAYILRFFKQPMIPAYILVGILIGPVLGLITDNEIITTLSEIGIAFLLFIVGLELDLKKLRDVGNVATVGGLIQIVILFVTGYLVAVLLGFGGISGVYFGFILAFSSTMVVIKLLSDKYELDTLHGRIVIGMLLIQDIIAILALTVLKDIANLSWKPFILTISQGIGFLVIAVLLGKYVFPSVFKFAAKHTELLFLASLSVCFAFSILFYQLGFSIAIGAFVAGITLANLPYNVEIVGRVKSLRDFFAVMFFTAIGAELVFVDLSTIILPLVIFTIFTVILLPVVTAIIIVMFGYKTRTAFLSGISLAQVSEFSLIILAQGLIIGHVSQDVFTITIIMALITMSITAYFIKYDNGLVQMFGRFLKPLEKFAKTQKELSHIRPDKGHAFVLIGMDRTGYAILKKMQQMHKDVVVVDFNPDIVKKLINKRVPCVYGDIADLEVVQKLRLNHVRMVISTIPNHQASLFLIKQIRKHNPRTTIIVTSYQVEDALGLYEEGADYVIIPHFLGGEHVSVMLEDISDDIDQLITHKLQHLKELRHRQKVHPHHR